MPAAPTVARSHPPSEASDVQLDSIWAKWRVDRSLIFIPSRSFSFTMPSIPRMWAFEATQNILKLFKFRDMVCRISSPLRASGSSHRIDATPRAKPKPQMVLGGLQPVQRKACGYTKGQWIIPARQQPFQHYNSAIGWGPTTRCRGSHTAFDNKTLINTRSLNLER